ncbi:MAG: hypothetical protein KDE26_15955 [Bacteroidetes bacterium]|nr:hypothetical protein [Bacteroidota bacterium]MCB0844749.1 hypothetical protein [Bacteroidota bacterium]
MKHSLQSLTLIAALILFPLWGSAQSDCRLKPEDLKPVIQRFNPFFSNHTWDAKSQLEMARMGDNRLIIITQDGCKRHHTTFNMMVDRKVATDNKDFWISEMRSMMHKVYWETNDYEEFAQDFEANFIRNFSAYGPNNQFNFPIGTRNFICEVNYSPERGGKITIEMVSFIFKERVHTERRGISTDEDDGWYGNAKRP